MNFFSSRTALQASGAIALSCIAYRGITLYLRNSITISITEVVHLPASDQSANSRRNKEPLVIKGKIEVETYLIRGYRFVLKLAATMRDEPQFGSGGGGGISGASRHRVLASRESSGRFSPSPHGSPRRGNASLKVEDVDPMVDKYELSQNSFICFTPASLMTARLMTYTTTPYNAASGDAGSSALLTASMSGADLGSSTTVLSNALQSSVVSNVMVRNCYLQSHESGFTHQQLSLKLEVVNPVYGLQLLVRLPHRRCRLMSADTGGVGNIVQPFEMKPHHLIWEIGAVDGSTQRKNNNSKTAGSETDPLTMNLLDAALSIVYDQPVDFCDDDEDADGSDSASDDPFSPPASQRKSGSSRRGSGGAASQLAASRGGSGQPNQSNKSRKREARVQQKQQERQQRRREAAALAGDGASAHTPTLEITYSASGLASGASIKKLQVASDRANWAPRSLFDRAVLQRFMPALEDLKLQKFAHYTTWFVQPVAITRVE